MNLDEAWYPPVPAGQRGQVEQGGAVLEKAGPTGWRTETSGAKATKSVSLRRTMRMEALHAAEWNPSKRREALLVRLANLARRRFT